MLPGTIYPLIGGAVSNQMALELSRHYGLSEVANNIMKQPTLYRPWLFDGVSGLPDHLLPILGDGYKITYNCALPHDLSYAYGNLGDRFGRRTADHNFRENLINKADVNPFKAYLCWLTVRALGTERLGLSFSWGFANKNRPYLSNSPINIAY